MLKSFDYKEEDDVVTNEQSLMLSVKTMGITKNMQISNPFSSIE